MNITQGFGPADLDNFYLCIKEAIRWREQPFNEYNEKLKSQGVLGYSINGNHKNISTRYSLKLSCCR